MNSTRSCFRRCASAKIGIRRARRCTLSRLPRRLVRPADLPFAAFLSAGLLQVGHQLVGAYTACMGLPLFRKRISGSSSLQDLGYTPTPGDEVEDLYLLLAYVKECIPGVQAVASGAIASDYQRLRVENVCSRLNLVSLAYLWHQPQRLLLRCEGTCGHCTLDCCSPCAC